MAQMHKKAIRKWLGTLWNRRDWRIAGISPHPHIMPRMSEQPGIDEREDAPISVIHLNVWSGKLETGLQGRFGGIPTC